MISLLSRTSTLGFFEESLGLSRIVGGVVLPLGRTTIRPMNLYLSKVVLFFLFVKVLFDLSL